MTVEHLVHSSDIFQSINVLGVVPQQLSDVSLNGIEHVEPTLPLSSSILMKRWHTLGTNCLGYICFAK